MGAKPRKGCCRRRSPGEEHQLQGLAWQFFLFFYSFGLIFSTGAALYRCLSLALDEQLQVHWGRGLLGFSVVLLALHFGEAAAELAHILLDGARQSARRSLLGQLCGLALVLGCAAGGFFAVLLASVLLLWNRVIVALDMSVACAVIAAKGFAYYKYATGQHVHSKEEMISFAELQPRLDFVVGVMGCGMIVCAGGAVFVAQALDSELGAVVAEWIILGAALFLHLLSLALFYSWQCCRRKQVHKYEVVN